MARKQTALTVLLRPEDARWLDEYCAEEGRKKSTLVAKLVHDYLIRQAALDRPTPQSPTESESSRSS